jgi:hypothetical protein
MSINYSISTESSLVSIVSEHSELILCVISNSIRKANTPLVTRCVTPNDTESVCIIVIENRNVNKM